MRRLLVPALTTVAMLALTLSLGVWQVERLQWKQGLLNEIDRGETSPPIALSEHPKPFSRVVVEGTVGPDVARYGADVRTDVNGPVMGARQIVALLRPGALPVMLDLGWAPAGWVMPHPAGPVRVEAYVRPPEVATWSSAQDDAASHRFFTLDPKAIGASLGYAAVEPFTLVALGTPGRFPEPASSLPRPPNDHLSYAITWFSLSAILATVFVVFANQTLRKGPRP